MRDSIKLAAALLACAPAAWATNGMNLEGYGPVAAGMGGASMAYDNGTAGLINNPATLGLMKSGSARLDVALGGLHPDVEAKWGAFSKRSGGDAYYMPALGYVRKDGRLTWGAGLMAQGGMGTEYGRNSFLSNGLSLGGVPYVSGQENRSELGIGRVMVPLAYDVSDTLRIGGTLDYLWGGLDLRMVMSGQMFGQFIVPGGTPLGSASGTMVTTLAGFMGGGFVTDVNWAQFDFSEGKNGMRQRLKTDGWAGNLGFVWQAGPRLSIGGVYHGKTSLGDMEGRGTLRMNATGPMLGGTATVPITGRLKVIDFQWPQTVGLGLAYQASDRLMLVADYKWLDWSDVMKNFRMRFFADAAQADPLAAGMVGAGATNLNATLVQKWRDQHVLLFGGAYRATEALTLRAGVNLARNPVPDRYMHPLFPATIRNHLTLGLGYAFDRVSSLDFSYTHAFRQSATNANMAGLKTTHSQNNWQLMYSHRF